MVIRSPIRSAIRGPLRGALESRFGQDNGLSITAPSAVLFANGDQPFSLDGVNVISFADAQFPQFVPDLYVDSVNGSDSNDGTTRANAKQTLAGVQSVMSAGDKIGFVRGSSWREQFNVTVDNLTFGVVGEGAAPVITLNDVVSGTWTQPDAGTYPDVWSISWSRTGTIAAIDYLRLTADGVAQTHQDSLANLQSNGGWRADSRTSASTTIYIKSVADPNSSGVVYEASKRAQAILGHDQLGANGAGDTAVINGPFEVVGSGQSYGPLAGGSTSQAKILAVGGGIHHITSEGALIEDAIALDVSTDLPSAPYVFTSYRSTSTDFNPVWKRSFIYGPGGTAKTNGTIGFYGHASTPSTNVETFTLEQCFAEGLHYGATCAADDFTVRGFYSNNCRHGILVGQPNAQITHSVFRSTSQASASAAVIDEGPTNTALNDRLIENCAIYSGSSSVQQRIIGMQDRAGSLTIRNCIIFCDDPGFVDTLISNTGTLGDFTLTIEYCVFVKYESSPTGVFYTLDVPSTGLTLVSDHNIWIGRTNVDCRVGGVNYNTLASWQAQGYDTNSVQPYTGTDRATILSTFFEGDPADGDFRLKAGLGTFGDGVSMNLAGPQAHWDWNTRTVASGAPSAWPDVPSSTAECRTYVADPTGWDFYGTGKTSQDSYTLDISIEASGTIDFNDTSLGYVTVNSGADASGAINLTGRLEQINALFADPEPVLDNWSSETLDMSMTITHDATSRAASKTISVLSLPDNPFITLTEQTTIGTNIVSSLTSALSGSAATLEIVSQSTYVRPIISGLTLTDNADGTFDIDLSTTGADGSIYYVVTTDTTAPSGGASTETELGYIISGNDLTNTAGDAADSQTVSASGAQNIASVTPASGAGTYNVYVVHRTATQAADASYVESLIAYDSVTVTSASVSQADIIAMNPEIFLSLENLTDVWQDTGPATTNVSASGQTVAQIDNLGTISGNAIQGVPATEPAYNETSGIRSIVATGTVNDDFLELTPGSSLGSNVHVFLTWKNNPADTNYAFLTGEIGSKYLGVAVDGDASTTLSGSAGSPTFWVNGTQYTTRDALHDALAAGGSPWNVIEIRNADLSGWTKFRPWMYTSGASAPTGNWADLVVIPNGFSAQDRLDIIAYLEARVGL